MSPLTMLIRRDVTADVTVVRVSGRLDLRNTVALRSTLVKCIADCPTAIVIDVSECVPATAGAVALFPTVARNQGALPKVAIIVCGIDRRWREAGLVALGSVRAYEDCADAMAAAADVRLYQRRVDLHLHRTVFAPARARDLVDAACDEWGLDGLKTSALLIISELVTNAVRHGARDIDVEAMLRDDFLHLRVHDGGVAPPVVVTAPEQGTLREYGRGLLILQRYATAWGYVLNQSRTGKVVWATLRTTPRPPTSLTDRGSLPREAPGSGPVIRND
jgi:anti-sigma regulatory factor (Ser/Thr protein kinase)